MKKFTKLAFAGLLTVVASSGVFAADGYIVHADPSQIGALAKQFRLKVRDISNGHGVYLVHAPGGANVGRSLAGHPAVAYAAPNNNVALPVANGGAAKFSLTTTPGPNNTVRTGAWLNQIPGSPVMTAGSVTGLGLPSLQLYLKQPAMTLINLPSDLFPDNVDGLNTTSYGRGVRVAVIDTWIDYANSTIQASLDKGSAFDAIQNVAPGSALGQIDQETSPFIDQETSPFIDQETSPFIDSTGTVLLNQETSPFIDQETSPFIDQETSPFIDGQGPVPPGYGHGTGVAGLIHRIAPGATIIPIRAFRTTGVGTMADVVQAIYHAVDVAKADVISMSWSSADDDNTLKQAINYAQQKGVICVSALANSNSSAKVFPAAIDRVIGVAATDNRDYKASFSGFGEDAFVTAPGDYITTTYPHSIDKNLSNHQHWQMSRGTSYAVPMVAATMAVLKSLQNGVDQNGARQTLQHSSDPIPDPVYKNQLGVGRLDVQQAIKAARGY